MRLQIAQNWNTVTTLVDDIAKTEITAPLTKDSVLNVDDFADSGLQTAGARLGFPPRFIRSLSTKHPVLANEVISALRDDYLQRGGLISRSFFGKIYAVLSDGYRILDDKEVTALASSSEYLMDAESIWYHISPERLQLRFVSKNKLYIDGDDSPLSICVFIDNSMVGASSLRVRFGIYRHACTNGMIWGLKDFELVREVHRGNKALELELQKALSAVPEYEERLIAFADAMSKTRSKVADMDKDAAVAYLSKKLHTGDATALEVYDMFMNTYGGVSRWALANAISDVAHKFEDIETRTEFETLALAAM